MSNGPIPIRYADAEQPADTLQGIARDVRKILTPAEEILYVALQNITSLSARPDSVVATTNRLIFYRPHLLAGVDFTDLQWQDVRDVSVDVGLFAAEFAATTVDGRVVAMGQLAREQAKRFYGIAQQLVQEWREKRRVREMEEARAHAGGIVLPPAATGSPAEDPVAKLARAKQMLEQGLISEAEFESVKAKILANM